MIYSASIMNCTACGSEVPGAGRFCPSCGSAVDIGGAATLEAKTTPPKRGLSPSPRISSSSSGYEARYVPGTTLADRYRIVSPLGKGGMGEVYRAEDLKLGQTVALKFLPRSVAQSEEALERFTREVRLARQVSHPNVCRVFDIGEISETEGAGKTFTHTFLTMEFVDGEDLSSLMRRIGRLPPDKAVEIARQLCAGLAAAHEHGIIHRDLKPANIMLDGRGRVRITDFGLAGLAADIGGREARAGTPAYMSPEQFAGGELSPKSDLYSLGLVLYEIFTGKRPFDASSSEEMARLREKSAPTAPSHFVKELDPLIERVILRCLEKDPAKRPASALQVAAALPGGDPLAAALAAGETPSPEMVAASGTTEGLRPVVAWAVLAGIFVLVIAAILFSAQAKLYRRVPLEKPPEELAGHAREILKSLGYSEPPVDTAMGFYEGKEFLGYITEHDKSKTRWDNLDTGAIVFWYRGSPRPLVTSNSSQDEPMLGTVWTDDPPLDVSGMTLVKLNPLSRLTQFIAVPPQVEKQDGAAPSPDWTPLFSAAGLDPSNWPQAQPMWTPPVYSDARAAWTGTLAERPDIPMRIEAAAYRGKPVYFELIGPWTSPSTHATVPADCPRTGGWSDCLCSDVFDAGGRRAIRSAEPAPGPGRSPWSWTHCKFCFCGVGGGLVLWRASHLWLRRIRPNLHVFELRNFLLLFLLGALHCHGAVCAPPLACYACLLEPRARGRLSGSVGGTRCACRLSFGSVFDHFRKTGMVCSLLARLSSAKAIFWSAVAISRCPYDHC